MWGTYARKKADGTIMWASKIMINKKQISGGIFHERIDAHMNSVELYEGLTGEKWKSNQEKLQNPDKIEDSFAYCPETGILTWKKVMNRKRKDLLGKKAGSAHHSGYEFVEFAGKGYAVHRLCYFLYHGRWPKSQIDHINGIRNDNRIKNLRDVEKSVNAQNQKEHRDGKLWGATWQKKQQKWAALFTYQKQKEYLGMFDSEEEAHRISVQRFQQLPKEITR
jgi:hypothetical protein